MHDEQRAVTRNILEGHHQTIVQRRRLTDLREKFLPKVAVVGAGVGVLQPATIAKVISKIR